jgi:hypothetical protein
MGTERAQRDNGVQQRIQPRQTDDVLSLLKLVVVQDEGGDGRGSALWWCVGWDGACIAVAVVMVLVPP